MHIQMAYQTSQAKDGVGVFPTTHYVQCQIDRPPKQIKQATHTHSSMHLHTRSCPKFTLVM